jgi:hypothetical protein
LVSLFLSAVLGKHPRDEMGGMEPNKRHQIDKKQKKCLVLFLSYIVVLVAHCSASFPLSVYVPVDQYPDINFLGLLIGPRGSTQKKMQDETGAKLLL